MDVERDNSIPSIPPPPPPIEDSNYTVTYGNGADTYTNNHMADDESVEAEHVVYTFAEEKGSKAGRKRWLCLMLSIVALMATIIALGAVYGNQRRQRNNNTISASKKQKQGTESSKADAAPASNATVAAPVSGSDITGGNVFNTPKEGTNCIEGNATGANVTGTICGDDNSAEVITTGTGNETNVTDAGADGSGAENFDPTPSPSTRGTVSATWSGTTSGSSSVTWRSRYCRRFPRSQGCQ
jgi:hypothetical protein